MATVEFSSSSDVIDSRDVIARIDELRDTLMDVGVIVETDGKETIDPVKRESHSLETEEYEELLELQKQASSSPDWEYGESLINEKYFTSYIEELINDCYEMPKEINSGNWPYRHMKIDYEAAAEEAKADYFEVTFFGHAFLIRA
jgi:hypothetical protein